MGVARGGNKQVKRRLYVQRRLALVLPAPLVSACAFAGAADAVDGTGGPTVGASAGAVAALLLRWGC